LRAPLEKGAALAVLGSAPPIRPATGRLLMEGEHLVAIREQADATETERKITLCNAG